MTLLFDYFSICHFQGQVVYEFVNPYPQFFGLNTTTGSIILVESVLPQLNIQYTVS